jgi:hypothetical protein
MQLSGEDLLRLNVMMAQNVRAVRIDENRMQVFGLTEDGEARLDLNPAGRHDQYIKLVREFLSGHVFGSPGGYPVFLSRWTRMGQANDENLQQLLMLGEPEAVMAVVHARGLTPEVGHCAWWCMPESENARRMLEKPLIVDSDLGPILADHLYEHLAFETEPGPMIESIRLMLQPGLVDEQKQSKLWRTSQRKNAYLVGFLQSIPDELPDRRAAHERYEEFSQLLADIQGNTYADRFLWLLGEAGQTYLQTAYAVMRKPANQDVVVYLLNTLHDRLGQAFPGDEGNTPEDIGSIDRMTQQLLDSSTDAYADVDRDWQRFVESCGAQQAELFSMLWLAQIAEPVVNKIFSQTTAEGTLMRKKLAPVLDPVFSHLDCLLGMH